MADVHEIFIRPNGKIECIYTDDTRFLVDQASSVKIKRGSNVEPTEDGQWIADMSPVGGPLSPSFKLRADALAWETAYLNNYLAAGGHS